MLEHSENLYMILLRGDIIRVIMVRPEAIRPGFFAMSTDVMLWNISVLTMHNSSIELSGHTAIAKPALTYQHELEKMKSNTIKT